MPTNAKEPVETVRYCQLCGKAITFYYAQEHLQRKFKFCCKKHKDEWYGTFPLSQSRLNVLELLEENGVMSLPNTDTVYRMSELNEDRYMPMIECVNKERTGRDRFYRITKFGKKVLDTYRGI